jgi:hypothetical protein
MAPALADRVDGRIWAAAAGVAGLAAVYAWWTQSAALAAARRAGRPQAIVAAIGTAVPPLSGTNAEFRDVVRGPSCAAAGGRGARWLACCPAAR